MTNHGFVIFQRDEIIINVNQNKVLIPNILFRNINQKWLFGQRAKIASSIWTHYPTTNISTSSLLSIEKDERQELINTVLREIKDHLGGIQKVVFVIPKTIQSYITEKSLDFLNKEFSVISFVELLFLTADLPKEEYSLLVYDGCLSSEMMLIKQNKGCIEPISAIYSSPIDTSLQSSMAMYLCQKEQLKISKLGRILAFSNYKEFVLDLGEKLPFQVQLENIDTTIYVENNVTAFKVKFLFYNIISEQVARYFLDKIEQNHYLKSILSQLVNEFSLLSDLDQKFLVTTLRELDMKNKLGERAHSQLRNIFLRRPSRSLKVGMVSPFSYGKSTLLNAVLGKKLLKDNILAETAVVTYVGYSTDYRIYSDGRDGRDSIVAACFSELETLKKELEKYTSVSGEQYQEGKTQSIYVSVPYDTQYPMIEWVDTPGLFTHHEFHEELTDQVIPELDFLVFLVDPEKIGEIKFLKKIEEYTKGKENKCVFVINKRDMFNENVVEDLIQELRRYMPSRLMDVPIFFVSGYFALKYKEFYDSGISFSTLQKDFNLYAMEDEGRYSGRSLKLHHLENIYELSHISELENYFQRMIRKELKREVLL